MSIPGGGGKELPTRQDHKRSPDGKIHSALTALTLQLKTNHLPPPFRMDVRTAVQEAVREWRNALTDLAEFLATRRRDPRALSPHVWSLIEAKVVRLLRAYGALGEAIQRITDNPLIHFFPPVPAENPPRFRPPSNEDAFLLARPGITRAHGSPTWSIDANASSSEDEE
jgi:hypothetical protein